jgi:SAM-dependent methyltransferase
MDPTELRQRKQAVIDRYGPWTDHNIHLGGDLYTLESRPVTPKWRRILQVVSDLAGQPLDRLRILDLACLEGQYAIEFARHGATAVGIEGREGNVAKARFAKDALGLDNLEFYQDDVRNLSAAKYGHFDVVLCLGLLYHLDSPGVFELTKQIGQVCRRLTVIDTYISLADKEQYTFEGRTYWGRGYFEHDADSSLDDRLKNAWASLDNPSSVWLTRASLLNLLNHVGFTSAYECHNPAEANKFKDRITLVGVKGTPQELLNVPGRAAEIPLDWPEKACADVHALNQRFGDVSGRVSRAIPKSLKRPARRLLQRLGVGGL